MAKVKVLLEKGETPLDADLMLLKAIQHHTTGDAHSKEAFSDPAMLDVATKLERAHKVVYENMIKEIIATLEGDYRGNIT